MESPKPSMESPKPSMESPKPSMASPKTAFKRRKNFRRFYSRRWRNPVLVLLSILFVMAFLGEIDTLWAETADLLTNKRPLEDEDSPSAQDIIPYSISNIASPFGYHLNLSENRDKASVAASLFGSYDKILETRQPMPNVAPLSGDLLANLQPLPEDASLSGDQQILRHLMAEPSDPPPPASNKTAQFPEDLFTLEERKKGAVVFHVIGLVYMFVALAIVCDEFFVPSLDVITEKAGISEDVAGATFMAAGGSAPELFTSIIGVFISYDDVGIGTIVGSAVFNILFVISMCAIFSRTVLELTWWPLFRDVSFYAVILILLMTFFKDSVIYWWEALILLFTYVCYVTFMKFNEPCEKFVKKLLNRNKVTRVGSADKLVPHMAKRKMSIPMLHSGSKFRSGLLQLMIHTIDPMHDGKLDEKETNLHAMASLRVLLEAQKANGSAVNTTMKTSASCPACSDCPDCTHGVQHPSMVDAHSFAPNMTPVAEDGGVNSPTSNVRVIWTANNSSAGTFMTRSIRSDPGDGHGGVLRTESVASEGTNQADSSQNVNIIMPISESKATIHHSNSNGSEVVVAPQDAEAEAPAEEEEDDDDKPLDISWPDTWQKRLNYILLAPIIFPLWLTLPDTRRPEKRKYFYVSFLGSIVWIAIFSYLMVWWASLVGETAGIPNEVMGLTFLAAGTSIPDLITSVLVARKGFGDMAVSSSVGSNIFDVSVGLPLPWFISTLIFGPVQVSSSGMACSLLLLFLMLLFVIISIAAFKWKMNVGLAGVMFFLYFVFIACSLMLEYGVVSCDDLLGK